MFNFLKGNVTKAYEKIMELRGSELNPNNIELIISEYSFSENELDILLSRLRKQGINIEYELEESDQYTSEDDDEVLYDEYDEEEIDDLEE